MNIGAEVPSHFSLSSTIHYPLHLSHVSMAMTLTHEICDSSEQVGPLATITNCSTMTALWQDTHNKERRSTGPLMFFMEKANRTIYNFVRNVLHCQSVIYNNDNISINMCLYDVHNSEHWSWKEIIGWLHQYIVSISFKHEMMVLNLNMILLCVVST